VSLSPPVHGQAIIPIHEAEGERGNCKEFPLRYQTPLAGQLLTARMGPTFISSSLPECEPDHDCQDKNHVFQPRRSMRNKPTRQPPVNLRSSAGEDEQDAGGDYARLADKDTLTNNDILAESNAGEPGQPSAGTKVKAYLQWLWWTFWIFVCWQLLTEACRRQGTSCYPDISLRLDSSHYVVTVSSRENLIQMEGKGGLHRYQIPLTSRDGDSSEYACPPNPFCSSAYRHLLTIPSSQIVSCQSQHQEHREQQLKQTKQANSLQPGTKTTQVSRRQS
jgi:hypothetical protein